MNREIVVTLWRQRLASPMRLLLLFFGFLPPMGIAMLTLSLGAVHGMAYLFALVLAAGAIGQDVSSGVLQLTLARPVTRSAYVTSRWFAAGAGGAALALAQLAGAALLLAVRGAAPAGLELLAAALTDLVAAFTGAAVIVALSACVGGLGDVALLVLALMSAQVGRWIATFRGWTFVVGALAELDRTLQPQLHLEWIAGRGVPEWTGLVAALSTIALGLAVAILVVNRRELSYAAD